MDSGRSFLPLIHDIQLTIQGRRDPAVPMCSYQIRNRRERCTPAEDGSFLPLLLSSAVCLTRKVQPRPGYLPKSEQEGADLLVVPSLYLRSVK
jgi:hypothetical protein